MSRTWSAYFDVTRPEDYRFLNFYEYRLQQSDFTSSFRQESDKLKKDLAILITNGSDKMKKGGFHSYGGHLLAAHLTVCLPAVEKENPHNYGRHLLAVYLTGHQEYFSEVDAFWLEIELHEELHVIEVEASKSIMHDTKNVIDTAIGNARSTIKNINTRLV
ncbi:658_t:CDS:2 [Ambispora gerdemannii]|uniref:658_t:CDS:1 n=1 Tax=Ambispora gerdemannii TaxID=144530 RepID=A0A9N8ZA20_9GLOM|nr:658_t:CDS:2 [Ambispora gerdemannii]